MKCTNCGRRLSRNAKVEVTIEGRGEYIVTEGMTYVNGISLFYLQATLVP